MGKIDLAARLVAEAGPTMIFCRTRHGVDRVARQLTEAGVAAGWIHGGRTQMQREAALHAFTTGRVRALVATDVAARGIHVDGVACVLHYDPPEDLNTYVHRSGRTARAGATGIVVSFVNADQVKATNRLQRELGLPELIDASSDTDEPRRADRPNPSGPSQESEPGQTPPSSKSKRTKPGKKQRARAKNVAWPKLI
jgi:superfamily II DNA/RNA helicase